MDIIGEKDFVLNIETALKLLKLKAFDEYLIAIKNIGLIREWFRSGMEPYKTPSTVNLSRKTAFKSLTWCASCIIHEAYHSKLYHDYLLRYPGQEVPELIWQGQEVERLCIKFQITTSEKINAPMKEIEYLNSLDGRHFLKTERDW